MESDRRKSPPVMANEPEKYACCDLWGDGKKKNSAEVRLKVRKTCGRQGSNSVKRTIKKKKVTLKPVR